MNGFQVFPVTSSPSAGPTLSWLSPPTATQTATCRPLRPLCASRTASRRCAPSSCPTPTCTAGSSSTSLWFSPSSSSSWRRRGSAWAPPSWWTTWTPNASPSPRQSRATRRPAAGGERGQAGGREEAEGGTELQNANGEFWCRKGEEKTNCRFYLWSLNVWLKQFF